MKQKTKMNPNHLSKAQDLKKVKNKDKKKTQEGFTLLSSSPLHRSVNSHSKERIQNIQPQSAYLQEEIRKSKTDLEKLSQKISVNPAKEAKLSFQTQEVNLITLLSPCSKNHNNNLTNNINNHNTDNDKILHESNLDSNGNKYTTPKYKETPNDNNHYHLHNNKKVCKASSSESRNRVVKRHFSSSLTQVKVNSYEVLLKNITEKITELNKEQNKEIWKKKSFDLYFYSLNQMQAISNDNTQKKIIKILIEGLNETFAKEKKTDNTMSNTTSFTTSNTIPTATATTASITKKELKKNNDPSTQNSLNQNPMKDTFSEITYKKKTISKYNHPAQFPSNNNINKIEVIKAKEAAPLRHSESTNNEETLSIDLDSIYFNDKFVNLTHSVSYSHIPKLNLEHCFNNKDNTGFHNKKKKIIYRSKSKANANKPQQKKKNIHQSFSLIKISKNVN